MRTKMSVYGMSLFGGWLNFYFTVDWNLVSISAGFECNRESFKVFVTILHWSLIVQINSLELDYIEDAEDK